MSKEFKQTAYVEALTSLPTMSQFLRKEDCEEARQKHMFTAGRALGRREMKGECKAVALEMAADEYTDWNPSDVCQAIEAISEEV